MSKQPAPQRRYSPAVYRRRRLAVLLALLAVIVAIVLIVIRPSFGGPAKGAGSPSPSSTAQPVSSAAPAANASPSAAASVAPADAEGAPCRAENIVVEAVSDKVSYAAGEQPQLSMRVTNTGKNSCTLNVGTKAQEFKISSGNEQYWSSLDCLVDATDQQVTLAPNKPLASAAPLVWDRTRSAKDTCQGSRPAVPAGGASYHLSVSVGGFTAGVTRQFLLY